MFEAKVAKDFTFQKFKAHGVFKKGEVITNLTAQDVDYLGGNNPYHTSFIEDVREMVVEVQEAVPETKSEKAVKNTRRKK